MKSFYIYLFLVFLYSDLFRICLSLGCDENSEFVCRTFDRKFETCLEFGQKCSKNVSVWNNYPFNNLSFEIEPTESNIFSFTSRTNLSTASRVRFRLRDFEQNSTTSHNLFDAGFLLILVNDSVGLQEWRFCSDFSTMNCSELNVPDSEFRTEVKIRMVVDISSGTALLSISLGQIKKSFHIDFDPKINGSLAFFVSAESDLIEDVRPFELLKFEQNVGANVELRSALNSYAIILVVAAAFFLCVLCGLAEKTPKVGERELTSNPDPEDDELEMGLIPDLPSDDRPKIVVQSSSVITTSSSCLSHSGLFWKHDLE